MPNTAANVVAGTPLAAGGVYIAPLGTALPTDPTTALNAAFKSAGYIGEDGLTESADRSTDKIKAWGGDTVKVVQTDFSLTYSFTFLESLNSDVLKAVYGSGTGVVTTTAATASAGTIYAVKVNGDVLPHNAFVFEIKDGYSRIRICVPDGQVTSVGEITYNNSDVVGYSVTIEAYKDSTTGANALKYLTDNKTTGGTYV